MPDFLGASPDFSPILMRLAQMFGGQAPSTPQPNTQAASVPPEQNAITQLMNYKPEHAASDLFMQNIQAMPQREQYPPSNLRKIGGVLAGLGSGVNAQGIASGSPIGFQGNPKSAMETSEAVTNQPYHRALGDWENRIKPLELAATNEKNYNLGNRQLLLGETGRMIAQQRADTYADRVRQIEEENYSKDVKRQADAKRDQGRLEAYQHIANGGTMKFGQNGQAYMVYKDGTTKAVDASIFSPQDMENLKEKNKEKLAGVTEANKEKFEGVQQPDRIAVKKTVPGKAAPNAPVIKPETGNEEARRRTNNAIQFKNQHPDLAKHITIGSNGKVDIKDPGGRNGPSDYEYDMMYNSIFRSRESQRDINLPKAKPVQQEEQDTTEEPEEERVTVTDMTGKALGTIKKSESGMLDKTRYKVK